ncbi:MAG: SH3 domain-containing protein [Clostridia bacterium]|nr:SH3 domain-containing protein [Clostridia bacterium]
MKKAKTICALAAILCLLLSALPAWADNFPGVYDFAIVSGTSTLNLRNGPSANDAWLGSAAEGTWVGLMGESGNWYRVFVPSLNQYGYMSKNYLKTASSGSSGASGTTGVVNNPKATQFLNLRQFPSYDSPVLGIFYNGAAFTVLSFNNGWYQVQMNGMIGYFRQEYVCINGSSGGSTAFIRTNNGGKLNLRTAPSYSGSSIIAQYPNGTQVNVLLKGKSSAGSTFYKVSIQGTIGYVDAAFLSSNGGYVPSVSPVTPPHPGFQPVTQGTAIVNNPKSTQYLNLRALPSSTAKVIAQYKNGIRFQVIEAGEKWCKVYGSASGNIGYMMTKYLKLSGVSNHPTKVVQNGGTYVNLRSAPSQSKGAIYQQVYSGAVVTVVTPGDEWTQVRYGNTTGYMMTKFLK